MKKLPLTILLILVGPVGAYIGFYNRITCKPSQAQFWIILALGMAVGASISIISQRIRAKNNTPGSV
ncbi:MAG TPA: hypothetical protein P5167_07285 [Bacteroidales bacterium]|nr:hypothetical protein [Bacteroidales bacterium]